MLAFICGAMFGGVVSIVAMCLFFVSKESDGDNYDD